MHHTLRAVHTLTKIRAMGEKKRKVVAVSLKAEGLKHMPHDKETKHVLH